MALLPLNLDVVSKRLIFSESNPRPFQIPDLHQEDTPTIEFRAFRKINEAVYPFFQRITLSGFDLLMTIGDAGSILASSGTFTISDSNTLLTGSLPLNTSGITALADGTIKTFEIRLFDGVNYYRAQTVCTIRKSVATVGALQPVVNDIALGVLQAQRTYVPFEMAPGAGFIMQNTAGVKCLIHLSEDAIPAILADPIA